MLSARVKDAVGLEVGALRVAAAIGALASALVVAQALVRHRSSETGVAVELIATQAELAALMSALRRGENGEGLRVTRGWRRELIGDELRELAAGRRSLSVAENGRLEVKPIG